MATLSFEGTITTGALSFISGITDLDLIGDGGTLTLFATTQVAPGVTAFALGADGQPDWIDRLSLGAQAAATALPPELEFVEIGGTTMAVPVGLNGPGIQGFALSAKGLSHTPTDLAAAASPVAKLVAVQVGGSTFLYVSQDETPGLIAYDLAGSQVAGGGSGELITDFTALTLADTAFLLATSSIPFTISSLKSPNMQLRAPWAKQEVEGVIVQDVGVKDRRVEQADNQKEQCPLDCHRDCLIEPLETRQPQPDPGEHNKGCRGASFQWRCQQVQQSRAAFGTLGDLEIDDHHSDKGDVAGKIEPLKPVTYWGRTCHFHCCFLKGWFQRFPEASCLA